MHEGRGATTQDRKRKKAGYSRVPLDAIVMHSSFFGMRSFSVVSKSIDTKQLHLTPCMDPLYKYGEAFVNGTSPGKDKELK